MLCFCDPASVLDMHCPEASLRGLSMLFCISETGKFLRSYLLKKMSWLQYYMLIVACDNDILTYLKEQLSWYSPLMFLDLAELLFVRWVWQGREGAVSSPVLWFCWPAWFSLYLFLIFIVFWLGKYPFISVKPHLLNFCFHLYFLIFWKLLALESILFGLLVTSKIQNS